MCTVTCQLLNPPDLHQSVSCPFLHNLCLTSLCPPHRNQLLTIPTSSLKCVAALLPLDPYLPLDPLSLHRQWILLLMLSFFLVFLVLSQLARPLSFLQYPNPADLLPPGLRYKQSRTGEWVWLLTCTYLAILSAPTACYATRLNCRPPFAPSKTLMLLFGPSTENWRRSCLGCVSHFSIMLIFRVFCSLS